MMLASFKLKKLQILRVDGMGKLMPSVFAQDNFDAKETAMPYKSIKKSMALRIPIVMALSSD